MVVLKYKDHKYLYHGRMGRVREVGAGNKLVNVRVELLGGGSVIVPRGNLFRIGQPVREYMGDKCLCCGTVIRTRRHPDHCVAFRNGYPYPCPKNGAFRVGEIEEEADIWLEAVFA